MDRYSGLVIGGPIAGEQRVHETDVMSIYEQPEYSYPPTSSPLSYIPSARKHVYYWCRVFQFPGQHGSFAVWIHESLYQPHNDPANALAVINHFKTAYIKYHSIKKEWGNV